MDKKSKKQANNSSINTGLSEEEIQEIKDIFELFVEEGNDSIQVEYLVESMKKFGFDTKAPAIFKMIQSIEKEEGEISLEMFIDMMTGRISKVNQKEDLERTFKLFDIEHDGIMSLDNLQRVAKELGEDVTEEELKEIIARGSVNNPDNNGILEEDFLEVMMKN